MSGIRGLSPPRILLGGRCLQPAGLLRPATPNPARAGKVFKDKLGTCGGGDTWQQVGARFRAQGAPRARSARAGQ